MKRVSLRRQSKYMLGGFRLQVLVLAVALAAAQPAHGQEIRVESGNLCAFKGVGRYEC